MEGAMEYRIYQPDGLHLVTVIRGGPDKVTDWLLDQSTEEFEIKWCEHDNGSWLQLSQPAAAWLTEFYHEVAMSEGHDV